MPGGRRNWPHQDVNTSFLINHARILYARSQRPFASQEYLGHSYRSVSPAVALASESSHLLRLLPLKGCVAGVSRTSDFIDTLASTSSKPITSAHTLLDHCGRAIMYESPLDEE